MIGQNKTIFPKKETIKFAKYASELLGVIILYMAGSVGYTLKYDAFNYPKEYTDLRNKKTELVRKIDEWQRFTPLMNSQFASQYKDSLENAVMDTGKIDLRMAEIKEDHDKITDKTEYSWLAFFMKD